MQRTLKTLTTATAAVLALSMPVLAEITPTPDGKNADHRITHFHYVENQVYRIPVGERLITYVHFPQGETVRSIGAGDTESFQITRLQEGRVIAFKPEILNSDSNLTVLTNRGSYNFYLVPAETTAERKNVPFRVTFYSNNKGGTTTTRGKVARGEPKPTGRFVNQNYSRSSKADFAPTAVWDDGVHTYMQIPQDEELPGIFRVLPDGRELMVNTTVKERGIIQVQGLSDLWTLRIEDDSICVRNDGDNYQQASARGQTGRPITSQTVKPGGSK
ncbi:TrbG/VirB9 family P-type conjugative transfer protein [uncultured Ruegeria sp.]|uniref:TrbG/VirB9 family P-type conjugative transfer protein n=1 Tax=uncultured Ruegeria sp. TaxID=259304 RepID=UPI00260C840F|nr:TrbG/VirB9 family P-type conjugative transfer protein [uncultured Ruegeria sp.]